MIHFDLPKEKSSIIKVIGVGGGGSNAVNYMFSQNIEGVNFIICNTDAQAISKSDVPNKIQLGPHLTQGLGAGANPEIGRQATEESLEEIKKILEVNTKMAFITAGMGGGTGTGGAPIIAKLCRDLGILTVGIVTTPFSYEGVKRMQQAQEGINRMKEYVDTLLVISNDKLRHQFGNLKMRDAFAKADNILATAAKCITDVINTTGQINVDFADVCTVMRNGGVAILGSAACGGEDRAFHAIEEAISSPLLNDNDIRGAKWILINITSAEGEHECTMDEVDIIQNHLLSQAGEGTDVILGMGYDNTLGDKIGITLVATGFGQKEEAEEKQQAVEEKKEEKIILSLHQPQPHPQSAKSVVIQPAQEKKVEPVRVVKEEQPLVKEELMPKLKVVAENNNGIFTVDDSKTTVEKNLQADKSEWLNSPSLNVKTNSDPAIRLELKDPENNSPSTAASGGYLAKPSNIYAEPPLDELNTPVATNHSSGLKVPFNETPVDETSSAEFQLVFKDEVPAADAPGAHQTSENVISDFSVEEPAMQDEAEIQKRKAAERIQKLRNLSFNINVADPNNEFETVPAYIRRNLELYNTISSAENFYSNYEVKNNENNIPGISTINTYLDGKKPD